MASDIVRGDSAGPQSSGAQQFFSRTLYVYFGKPLLFLVPALLITAFGVYSAVTEPEEYRSVGSLNVSSDTFLNQLSQVRSSDFNFETPATAVARQFNEYMQTNGFPDEVVASAGLTTELARGEFTLDDIRSSVFAVASGDSLLRVIAVAEVPERARLLAVSAISTYKNVVLASEVDQQNTAESLFDGQVAGYKTEVDRATDDLNNYLEAHPAPVDPRDDYNVAEQSSIQRLNDQLTRAQARLDGAIDKREESRQAAVTSSADIDQRLKLIDEPTLPTAPESGLKVLLTTVFTYGALGLLVSVGAVALASVLDRSVHSAADIERLGASVRAVVPRARSMRVPPRHLAPVPNERVAPMRSAG